MDDLENRRRETFQRVEGFGVAHAADFGENSLGKQFFAAMAVIVTRLDGLAAAQASGRGASREGTSTRAVARAALREDLDAISRTARAIAVDNAGIDDKFRIPRGENDQVLLAAARAFATDAAPLSAQFIAHELSANIISELNTSIANLETAISHQSSAAGDRVGAGAGIDETIDEGISTLRKLDPIVRNKYANDPATLAEWTSASHTERSPRHKAAPPRTNTAGSPPA